MRAESVSLAHAMWRGFRMRCPHCGQGALFGRFLKVADHCPKCDEELFHHCADDFPAYLVIAAVGHVIVPAILAVETAYAPALWLQLLIWLPVTTTERTRIIAADQRSDRGPAMATWNAWIRDLETPAPGRRLVQGFIRRSRCGLTGGRRTR
jgi:uncharacterized protein (DUF983 family)